MKKVKIAFVGLMLVLFGGSLFAQAEKVQAMFIYNFTRFIEWPESSFQGEFVIGVLGNKAIYEELVAVSKDKVVANKKIVVKYFSNPKEITQSHIMVVGQRYASSFEVVKSTIGNFPSLLVSEKEGQSSRGSSISFKMVDDKMKFEMSRNNIKDKGLSVDRRLEMMAMVVD